MENLDWLSDFLDQSIPIWQKDPVIYCKEVLQFIPDSWQADAMRDLAKNPKVTIKSGQGVGKTAMEAAVFLWFITCFPYPRIVATAPTKQQLHDVLWSEISKWMSKSDLLSMLLKWTKTYVYIFRYYNLLLIIIVCHSEKSNRYLLSFNIKYYQAINF